MHHTLFVRLLQSTRRLAHTGAGFGHRQRTLLRDEPSEIHAVHVFHYQDVHLAYFLGVVCRNDVWMRESGGRLHLPMKSFNGLRTGDKTLGNGSGQSWRPEFVLTFWREAPPHCGATQ